MSFFILAHVLLPAALTFAVAALVADYRGIIGHPPGTRHARVGANQSSAEKQRTQPDSGKAQKPDSSSPTASKSPPDAEEKPDNADAASAPTADEETDGTQPAGESSVADSGHPDNSGESPDGEGPDSTSAGTENKPSSEAAESAQTDDPQTGRAQSGRPQTGGAQTGRPQDPERDHLQPPLLQPADREVLFQAGKLDGLPAEDSASLCEHEFGMLSDESRDVLEFKVKDGKTFELPQYLMGQQKIVITLPEYERRDLVFRARIPSASKNRTLRVLFNGHAIYQRIVEKEGIMLSALIPAKWLEDYENTLVISNPARRPVQYDALWIEEAAPLRRRVSFAVGALEEFPSAQRAQLPSPEINVPEKHRERLRGSCAPFREAFDQIGNRVASEEPLKNQMSVAWNFFPYFGAMRYQERVIRRLLTGVMGFYFNGGDHLRLTSGTGAGKFFAPAGGKPYPTAAALEELALLFRGSDTRRLHLNVTPSMSTNKVNPGLVWLGVQHSENSASFLVSRAYHGLSPKGVRLRASVPWTGKTELEVYRNVIPRFFHMQVPRYRSGSGEYERTREKSSETITVPANGDGRGLLRFDAGFREALLVRACRKGEGFPPPPGQKRQRKIESGSGIRKVAARVTDSAVEPFTEFDSGPIRHLLDGRLCSFYEVERAEATKGDIGDVSHVIPFNEKSLFFSPQYDNAPSNAAEGVAMGVGSFGSMSGDAFSFWVYPHVSNLEEKKEDAFKPNAGDSLQVHLQVRLGRKMYTASLQPGQWQRVECDISRDQRRTDNAVDSYIVFKTDRNWREYKRGLDVKFEINGAAFIEKPDRKVLSKIHTADSGEQLNVVLLGPRADA